MLRLPIALLAVLLVAGCKGGAGAPVEASAPAAQATPVAADETTAPGTEAAATPPPPQNAASEPAAPPPDLSSPEALFATFQGAVRDWDLELMFVCLGEDPAAAAAFAEFSEEFAAEKDEIVACIVPASLGAVEPGSAPGQVRFSLEGCPSKPGMTGTMVEQPDGSWRLRGL